MNEVYIPEIFNENEGELHIENVSLKSIAEKYGTPVYVTSALRIEQNYNEILQAFRKRLDNFSIKYAVKANSNPNIIRILAKMGAGADVSNLTEYELAKLGGIPDKKIIMTPNNMDAQSLREMSKKGITINFDDINQMNSVKDSLPEIVSFRINPGRGKGEFPGTTTAGPEAKFGLPLEKAMEGYSMAKEAGATKFGIHMMTGSNVLDPAYFGSISSVIFDLSIELSKTLEIEFSYIDIGGGFGVPYRPGETRLDMDKVAENICTEMKRKFSSAGLKMPDLYMEPGRYLVSDSTVLVGKVTNIKDNGKIFIGTDMGMTTLLRPALYGAYHHISPVISGTKGKTIEHCKIVGQVCENTDVIGEGRTFPTLSVGDLLAVFNAGAYGYSMSMNFNGNLRPAEILIRDGKDILIRRRETVQDIVHTVV